MEYINRYMEAKFLRMTKHFRAVLLNGPRQVGKTTMLERLAKNTQRTYVTLDNLQARSLAKKDPELFFQNYKTPIMIDEVQYAPELFPYIKILCDTHQQPGEFWLTGSQSYSMMKNVTESLAGRVGIMQIYPFSFNELRDVPMSDTPFFVDFDWLKARENVVKPADVKEVFSYIWQGGMPEAAGATPERREVLFESYIHSYLMRDVIELGGVTDTVKFRRFLTACSAETAQQLNLTKIAGIAEIAATTAKDWLRLLEGLHIVHLVQPYSNNQLKRLTKMPKLYFWDTGLCAYLGKWLSPDTLYNGAAAGAYFETFAVAELLKHYAYSSFTPNVCYYRDSNAKEIDLVLETGGQIYPLEIKLAVSPNNRDVKRYELLDKASLPRAMGGIICMHQGVAFIDRQNLIIPAYLF
jgi:predicted AAA+ superfamily ATPase